MQTKYKAQKLVDVLSVPKIRLQKFHPFIFIIFSKIQLWKQQVQEGNPFLSDTQNENGICQWVLSV